VPDDRIDTLAHAGLRFDVTDSGPVDGTPVVLLHGFPTDRTSWDRLAPLLHAAGLRTFAPDQRGYSAGARPAGTAPYRLEHLVADVVALIDATGREKVHVVGHDWGGAIAWLTAGNHPDRVASVTALSTPHPGALSRALRTPDQLRRSWYMAAFQVPFLPECSVAFGFRSLLGGSGLPEDDVERYAAHLARPEVIRGPITWYRAARSSHVRAHRVAVPATLAWGSRDFALGRYAAELTAEHVTGPYEFVELEAGHWLPETRAPECADAILRRVGSL
jgi:pimeloyl-ACP methyl ester carboxylesterase